VAAAVAFIAANPHTESWKVPEAVEGEAIFKDVELPA
jgi:hypothetical protein